MPVFIILSFFLSFFLSLSLSLWFQPNPSFRIRYLCLVFASIYLIFCVAKSLKSQHLYLNNSFFYCCCSVNFVFLFLSILVYCFSFSVTILSVIFTLLNDLKWSYFTFLSLFLFPSSVLRFQSPPPTQTCVLHFLFFCSSVCPFLLSSPSIKRPRPNDFYVKGQLILFAFSLSLSSIHSLPDSNFVQ